MASSSTTTICCDDMRDDQQLGWLSAHLQFYTDLVGITADDETDPTVVTDDEEFCKFAWTYTKDVYRSIYRLIHIKSVGDTDTLTNQELSVISNPTGGQKHAQQQIWIKQLLYGLNYTCTGPSSQVDGTAYALDSTIPLRTGATLTEDVGEWLVKMAQHEQFTTGTVHATSSSSSPILAPAFQSLIAREPTWSLTNGTFFDDDAKMTLLTAALIAARTTRSKLILYPVKRTLHDTVRDEYTNWDQIAIKPMTDDLAEVLALDKDVQNRLFKKYARFSLR